MSILKQALEWACNIWFVLCGVNSAEMVLWNRPAYRIRPEYDEAGNVTGIKMILIKTTQFIKIPKRHGLMDSFLNGTIIPAILLDANDSSWRIDTECKSAMVKFLNMRLLTRWKHDILAGKALPNSSPPVAWFHPTANRQPESLVYIATPEQIGEITGMDPYAQIERVNKALGPASTPAGWETTSCSHKELKLLVVDENHMEMIFNSNGLSVEDGPVILKDYAVKLKPYISEVGKVLGVISHFMSFKNLSFQIRVRGEAKINGEQRVIISKCNCNGGTAIINTYAKVLNIPDEVIVGIDGLLRCDNMKSKNVKAGDIITLTVKKFEIAKTANTEAENSSSFGVQAVVGNQILSRILHKEHSVAEIKEMDGESVQIYRAAIFRKAIWEADLASNLHILVGDKKEISMADFKSISTALLCNGIVGNDGKLKVCFTDTWLNTLIPRWLRFLRDKVWTIQGSKYSQYIAAARIMKVGDSIMNELDDLKIRYFKETGTWIYPVLPPKGTIVNIALDLWRFVNRKKDPQTSSLNLQGCSFCYRDDNGVLQFLGNDLQDVGMLQRMEFSDIPNGWSTPTSDEFGEDKDGDLISILLSRLVHLGSHGYIFPSIAGTAKEKTVFSKPTTFEDWAKYIEYINTQYDGYAIAAKNTGMLDLETRLQCCTALIRGNLGKDGAPFTQKTQRMFNYIREELGIKIGKHGLGGKSGGALQGDPQELLRSLTYGEIEPRAWPNLFRATHKYGGAPLAYRSNNRFVLNCIMKAVLNAETQTKDGKKIDFFLDYAFAIIRKAKTVSAKLQIPFADRNGTRELADQYHKLWEKKRNELTQGCIFNQQSVINFIGEKRVKTSSVLYYHSQGANYFEGIRNIYANLSSGYQQMYNKAEMYRSLGLAMTYILSYYPYYRGIWDARKILRTFATSRYLRFKPVESLLYKDETTLTLEERTALEDKGWFDKGVIKEEDGSFIVFEKGFKNSTIDALKEVEVERILKQFPKFWKIEDAKERIRQVDNFLMLCIIYAGTKGFGVGSGGESGRGYTKTATILNYFPAELYVEVARMRYSMIGVACSLLDELPTLWARHEEYISLTGIAEESSD
jgi:hypothetical protein